MKTSRDPHLRDLQTSKRHEPKRDRRKHVAPVVALAIITGLSGLGYYAVFRLQGLWLAERWPALDVLRRSINDPSSGSYPSFAHALVFSLLGLLLSGSHLAKLHRYLLIVALGTLALESSIGVFDLRDVGALLSGLCLPLLWWRSTGRHLQNSAADPGHSRWTEAGLVLVACTTALGSYDWGAGCARYEGNSCVEQKKWAKPIYLSYADLRSAVEITEPRTPATVGKLYLHGQYLFIVERNLGVHIVDNRFPFTPVRKAFLKIPGNTEVTIANNYLYADSYVDLLTIDLNNPDDIRVIKREENISRMIRSRISLITSRFALSI